MFSVVFHAGTILIKAVIATDWRTGVATDYVHFLTSLLVFLALPAAVRKLILFIATACFSSCKALCTSMRIGKATGIAKCMLLCRILSEISYSTVRLILFHYMKLCCCIFSSLFYFLGLFFANPILFAILQDVLQH